MAPRIRIGTQGWNYEAWVGPFYPDGTKPAEFLSVYARAFDTVEIDSTFYAIPPSKTVRGWAQRTPDDFMFALKMPQEITHERRLRDVDDIAELFFDRARELDDKLGPILIQLGPDFGPNELPAVAQFLPKLPRDIRFAIEFRQRAWIHEGVLALLAEHGVSLALTDARWIPRKQMLALANRPTADFVYVRLHGASALYVSGYTAAQLKQWSARIDRWRRGGESPRANRISAAHAPKRATRDVYCYFDNTAKVFAPANARRMLNILASTTRTWTSFGRRCDRN